MALIPRMLHPAVIVRRKATYNGIFGNSTFWRVVAVFVFGRGLLRKFFGRQPETIDISRFGAGNEYRVITEQPTTRRQRKKARKAGYDIPTKSDREALARIWLDREETEREEIVRDSKRFWKRF